MSIPVEYINLYSTSGSVDSITTTGSYSVTFDYYDIARNQLDGIIININITT